ncbi:AAA family ATPase [Pedobacter frigiditerrae]|uniref:AAA family ATPase n=1 Tax=Pedobacter frigiditerrae TaxID=2530452 RepID=UPI0029310F45|nr:AAA family ATPase [Pedobacter frigiditerrae]
MKSRQKSNNDLKIIAIKPCNDCHKDYVKVLKKDRIYFLYNDYKINEETDTISHEPSIPINLYSQGKLAINISAIAGQNGSGKSSLIELLFMAINNIAVVNELNEDLKPVMGLSVELYCFIGDYYKIKIKDKNISFFGYEKDGTIRSKEIEKFDLNHFFFTIAVNYSLYAYNTREIRVGQEDWLSGLFHKNDSYQTPLVINPWRKDGNIEINNENHLVRLRLMSNLLRPEISSGFNFRNLTDNLKVVKIRLTANREKSRHALYEIPNPDKNIKTPKKIYLRDLKKIDKDEILRKINRIYSFKYKKPSQAREIEATDYLIGKLVSIAVTYNEYKNENYYSKENENFDMERIDVFLKAVLEDRSHISFKIKQTLNFLKYPYLDFESVDYDVPELSKKIAEIIQKSRSPKPKIDELVPPPIFNVDILLALEGEEQVKEENLIPFRTLSSGERQMIYSISSLVYHLINLDSVRRYKEKKKYEYINIVLEEIELYFHPEMQRCFIQKLLDSIRNIELQTIRGINLCFITHSPFILSDIPDANVMFLEVVEQVSQLANREQKTFGANIHDLLSDGFFMYNGFSGAFATKKITETINFLEYSIKVKEYNKANADKFNSNGLLKDGIVEDEQMKVDQYVLEDLYDSFYEKNKEEHFKLIQAIGESVLRVKLLEMYDEAFSENRAEILQRQIARLVEELNLEQKKSR